MIPRNYVADENPFQLAQPPAWWLEGIELFDPDLLMLPSRERPVHWLTRRRRLTKGITGDITITGDPAAGVGVGPDTRMFIRYQVVPVTYIIRLSAHWALEPYLAWLRERDTWRADGGPLTEAEIQEAARNGGSKYTKELEANEAALEAKRAQEQRDRIYQATGEGWRSLQARLGRRILNAGPASRPAVHQ